MSGAWTPGPWVEGVGLSTGKRVIAPKATKAKFNIAHVGGPDRDANSRLIASAPELFDALLALRNECSGGPRPAMLRLLLAQADAALAKARAS